MFIETNISKIKEKNQYFCGSKLHVILGKPGVGKAIHPWDCLNKCECGSIPYLHGKGGDYETGEPYEVICHKCYKHTNKGTYDEVVREWNISIAEKHPAGNNLERQHTQQER